MVILEYDGSMNGLLCCIFEVYEHKLPLVRILKQGIFIQDAFAEVKKVITEKEKAQRVWKGLCKKLSYNARQQFYYSYLSELVGMEDMLLRYACHVFNASHNVEEDYSNKDVLEVAQTARKVGREKHRMKHSYAFSY